MFRSIILVISIVVLWCAPAHAELSPDALVKETTEKVLDELSANRATYRSDTAQLYAMVNEVVLPHFDFERMSKLVLGRHWRDASPTQREKFEQEFKSLLVRTYATALFEYTGQRIVYKPFRPQEGAKRVLVKTELVPNDGPPIPIDYALSVSDDAWQVYDVRIDGISMVTNYRNTYGKMIESRGMDALIDSLSQRREALSG